MKKFYDFLFRCFDVLCTVIIIYETWQSRKIIIGWIRNKLTEIEVKKLKRRMLKQIWEESI